MQGTTGNLAGMFSNDFKSIASFIGIVSGASLAVITPVMILKMDIDKHQDKADVQLKEVKASLEKRIDEVNASLEKRIDEVNASLEKRIDKLETKMDGNSATLNLILIEMTAQRRKR